MTDPFWPPGTDWRSLEPRDQKLIYEEMKRHFQERTWLASVLNDFRNHLLDAITSVVHSREELAAQYGVTRDVRWLNNRIDEASRLNDLLERAKQDLDEGHSLPVVDAYPDPHSDILYVTDLIRLCGLLHLYTQPPAQARDNLLAYLKDLHTGRGANHLIYRRAVAEWLRGEAWKRQHTGPMEVALVGDAVAAALKAAAAHFDEPEATAELAAND